MQLTARASAVTLPVQRSSFTAATVTVGALLLVFLLDRATGVAPVQHLYYLPIILAALRFKMRGAAVTALTAIVLYHVANPNLLTLAYEETDVVQIALFLAVGGVAARLSADAERLHHLAMTDDLTGLHNLRSFEARLASMVGAAQASGAPLVLAVLDLDRLKSLNDQHGHLIGAEAVRTVGQLIAARIPPHAVASRYGGDEFVIALPDCDLARARELAERLAQDVRTAAPVLAKRPFPAGTLSISVGVACATFTAGTIAATQAPSDAGEALFRAADAALYQAKAQGRDRVCAAPLPA